MRNSTIQYRNLYEIFLCSFNALRDSSCYFTCFSQAITDETFTVTYNDDSSESECTTTFCNLCHTVDSNQAILQFYITIYFYFIHCHNRLKFKTSLACCISEFLNTTMVKITITVKNYSLNTSGESVFSNQFTDFLSLLLLWHLLEAERRSGSKCFTSQIIYYLSIYLLVRAKYTKTWALSCSVHAFTDTKLYLNPSCYFLCCHNRT